MNCAKTNFIILCCNGSTQSTVKYKLPKFVVEYISLYKLGLYI